MTAANKYFQAVDKVLQKIRDTQMDNIQKTAELIANAVMEKKLIYICGCSHTAMMAHELVYRAGGMILYNPLYVPGCDMYLRPLPMCSDIERIEGLGRVTAENSPISEGDVLIVASVSGRNAVPIEVAMVGKERKAHLVVLTALDYTTQVTSRHSSGKRLFELDAEVVLDYCVEKGDAAVELEGLPVKTGGTSTIAGIYILNAVATQAIDLLLQKGFTPPVFLSGNLDGGDEHNHRLLNEYKDRLTYM